MSPKKLKESIYIDRMYRRHCRIRRVRGKQEEFETAPSSRFRCVRMLVLFVFLFSLFSYVYAVNRNAVSGYAIRSAEKRVADLSNEAQKLRIREAELRSLSGLEASSGELHMIPLQDTVSLEESGPVAFR